MAVGTKKVKQAGKFGARYGSKVKEKWLAIASKQAKKQQCPFCKKLHVKRQAKGIWYCNGCGKKFASHTYYLKEK
jgi:large subunit ribosomal protein L37Ae